MMKRFDLWCYDEVIIMNVQTLEKQVDTYAFTTANGYHNLIHSFIFNMIKIYLF